MSERYVSSLVIRRLPKYYRFLKELERNGQDRVSSSAIARSLGFTASQVRQDFSCFGEFGQQGYGYNVSTLLYEISEIIGVNRAHSAAIIGVGNLGHALVNNFNFKNCGFDLVAAFDADPKLIGSKIGEVNIYDVKSLAEVFRKTPFEVAVLTVPKAYVRDIAKKVADLGVRGIWNFTSVDLSLSELGVMVENVHFAESLMTLCYKISEE